MAGIKVTEADRWFSMCIRQRDRWRCRHCGTQYSHPAPGLECAHIVGRREKSVRWCADNALALCTRCHMHFTGEPVAFTRWLEREIGTGMLDLIQEKRLRIGKSTPQIRKEISAHYRNQFKLMEEDWQHQLVSWN